MTEIKSNGATEATSVTITARNNRDMQTQSNFLIRPLSPTGRLKVASKSLATAWGLSFLCLFIPVLHFVLVPGGVIIGLFFFYRKLSLRALLLEGFILCPKCNYEFPAEKGGFNWPKRENCPSCGVDLTINT